MTQNILNLKRFNTLGLNAYCKSLEILEKEQDIKTLIKDSNDKFIILGEGSNVILDAPIDSPFEVPVFINRLKGITVQKSQTEGDCALWCWRKLEQICPLDVRE